MSATRGYIKIRRSVGVFLSLTCRPPPHTTLNMAVKPLALWVLAAIALFGGVHAQPSPDVQKRISAAIKEAGQSNSTNVDYTQFVNVFIGTDNFGDVWCVSRFSDSYLHTRAHLNISPCLVKPWSICALWHGASCTFSC